MQGLCYELDAGFQFAARMLPVLVDYDSLVHRQERYPIWAYGVLGQSVQYTKVLLVLLMLLLLLLLLWILSLLLRLTLFQQHFSCSATTSYQDDVPRRQNKCQPVVCKKPMTSLLYTKVKIFCQKQKQNLNHPGIEPMMSARKSGWYTRSMGLFHIVFVTTTGLHKICQHSSLIYYERYQNHIYTQK